MLQLITGRSGSGKTQALYDDMRQVLTADEAAQVVLLVPEQASFENERRLLKDFGAQLSQRVQVLSFTRLANTVFREIGGVCAKRMDATVSLLLMSQALLEVSDHLQLFRGHTESTEYLEALLGMLAECKQCGISTTALTETAATLPSGVLRTKAEELALIFEAYEALVAGAQLIDPLDELTVLANRFSESHGFDGVYVFVDGFKGFTGQEFSVLEQLMTRAARLTVTLCTDRLPEAAQPDLDRFFTANHTGARLRQAAFSRHIPVAKPRHLSCNHRTPSEPLQALEEGIYTPSPRVYEGEAEAVCVVPCADAAQECAFAARTVRRLLRENGGYCRNFTVVTRQLSTYAGLLETAFEREGLPYHIDRRESILTQPLITLLESALAAVTNGFNSADILRLCKTGLAGYAAYSVSQLENYIFIWNITGKGWQQPFEHHPDGPGETVTAKSESRLAYLNVLRRRIARPLAQLQTRLSGKITGRDFAAALWQLLTELRVPRMVRLQAARLTACGEMALAEYQARMWDHTVELLNTFATALPDCHITASRFAQLFHLAVASADLGVIPQALDGVAIGAAHHIRYTHPKTVIILGANEGVFPANPASGGMLTDKERRRLMEAGLPMADDMDHQSAEERYYAYAAVAAPSQRLIVTYANRCGKDTLFPSTLIGEIERILPGHATAEAVDPAAGDTEAAADAFSRMADSWQEDSVAAATLREVFSADEAYAVKIEAATHTADTFALTDTALAKQLFGTKMQLSPSQVERYHNCRFSYFCQYGIRLRPRKAATFDTAKAGTLAHHVMQELLPIYAAEEWKGCTRARVYADTARAVKAYVETNLGGLEDSRFYDLMRQAARLSGELLWRVIREFQNSRFVPVDFELPIGKKEDNPVYIEPWVLTAPDGTTVQVRGTVDRVDILKHGDTTYVRVVDYKTYKKSFRLSDIVEGLDLQLLIYLFSLCENGGSRYGNVTPAGVLYLPAALPEISVERDASPEQVELQQLKTMCMNGLLLDDPQVLEAMEADLNGIFIPASRTKKGEFSTRSSLATLAQFGRIQKKIEALLLQMAETLHRGDVAAVPAGGDADGCFFCEYRDICGHEETDPIREIADRDLKTVLTELDAEYPEDAPEKEAEAHG